MWGICMPIFRPPVPLVWEEEEVTGGWIISYFRSKCAEKLKLSPVARDRLQLPCLIRLINVN